MPRIALAALALASASLLLVSCPFLGRDMFPSSLQYEEASIDLGAELDGLGLAYSRVAKIERLTPRGGAPRLFALLETGSGPRLAVLDDGLDRVEALFDSSGASLSGFMLGDAAGGYACGQLLLDGNLAALTPATDSSLLYGDASGYVDEASGGNVALYANGMNTLYKVAFDGSWAATAPNMAMLFSDSSMHYVADILSLDAASIFALALLPNYGSQPRILVCADRAAFEAAMLSPPLESGSRLLYLSFSISDRKLWLTEGGIVAFRSDSDRKRLSRIDYGDGEELDSLFLDDSAGEDCFSFDSAGEYWYRYEAETRRLHKLRTWW